MLQLIINTCISLCLNLAIQTTTSPISWTTAWSHNNQFIAVGNDNGELSIYDTKNWGRIKYWKYPNTTITRIEWSPKETILAVASFSHEKTTPRIQLYTIDKNQIITTLPDSLQGRGISWKPDGEQIAFVGTRGQISIYTKKGALVKKLSFSNPGSLFAIDWHPTKNIILGVEDDIFLIDIDKDSLIAKFSDGAINKGILCCKWHPTGNFFVTGDYGHEVERGEPSYLKFWKPNGTLIQKINNSKNEYRNLAWSLNGKYLAAATDVLLVYDQHGNTISKTKFDNNNLWGISWNNNGTAIVSSDQNSSIRITDMHGKIYKQFNH